MQGQQQRTLLLLLLLLALRRWRAPIAATCSITLLLFSPSRMCAALHTCTLLGHADAVAAQLLPQLLLLPACLRCKHC